jgi:transposase-like protein
MYGPGEPLQARSMSEDKDQEETSQCPACGGSLVVAWIIPRMAHLPEVQTFKCAECQRLFSDEGNPSQPLIELRAG